MVEWVLKLNRLVILSGLRKFKGSVWDFLVIAKTCFTSIWYWIPVLFQAYMLFQFWLIFFVHPLTLLILPAVLVAYLLWREQKRSEIRYGLKKKLSSYSIGTKVESRSKVELALDEYEKTIKRKRKNKEAEK